jgi:UDP-2,3-diacylglucosamine pyrophosphatase LpxH
MHDAGVPLATAREARTIALADLHLTKSSEPEVIADLAGLLGEHAGCQIVFVGDFFDLVTAAPDQDGRDAIREVMAAHPTLREALGRHLDGGGSLLFCSGNHDAAVGHDAFREVLLESIGPEHTSRQRLSSTPWFMRLGKTHIEHGHHYDPDNALSDPLALGERSLGIHFSSEFIHPTGAHRYLNANDDTPLKLFLSAFRWYGLRAPYVVYRYFHAAFTALARSGPFYRGAERGADVVASQAEFAARWGIDQQTIASLRAAGSQPTLQSLPDTFARLYMDRVTASVLCLAGGAAMLASGPRTGVRRKLGGLSLAAGVALMTASWLRGHSRYAGNVIEHLDRAASELRDCTDAQLVVFGHTHREADGEGYANTGSFAFPRAAPGRPFLELEKLSLTPRAVRRHWAA